MLCRNLFRKLFFSYSLVLLVPAALNPFTGFSSPVVQLPDSAITGSALHDTTKATLPDTAFAKTALPKISLNKNVTGFVKAYVKKEEAFLQKMKSRSHSYFRIIENIFKKDRLPHQLKYLAIVESELRTGAKSNAGAQGLWQLMPVTARELGLKISGKTDERLHTQRSTVAAARYLRYLYDEFDDWLLVLAAYNGGPGTVYKAMKKAGSKNYWTLQRFLPEESRRHVKRFIGIHYFFEGEGSIVTQTKAEAKAWQEQLCAGEMACLQASW